MCDLIGVREVRKAGCQLCWCLSVLVSVGATRKQREAGNGALGGLWCPVSMVWQGRLPATCREVLLAQEGEGCGIHLSISYKPSGCLRSSAGFSVQPGLSAGLTGVVPPVAAVLSPSKDRKRLMSRSASLAITER